MSAPQLLTTEQVAERLAISPEGVLRLVRARRLPVKKLGMRTYRFRETDLERFVQRLPGVEPEEAQG